MSTMKIRAKAIKELEDAFGRVTAERLFEAAHNKKHPLHDDFEWNKERGWREHNLDIARSIITSVRYVYTTEVKKVSSVGYVRDPDAAPNEQGYIAVSRLRTEREKAIEAMLAETTRVQSMLERARELAEVLDLQSELAQILEGIETLASRLRKGTGVEPQHPMHS